MWSRLFGAQPFAWTARSSRKPAALWRSPRGFTATLSRVFFASTTTPSTHRGFE
ncbi:hypothetical protein BDY19DRAFT_473032 [Irpex rosettiformis]|uniref:Uncharacterized protein n=1 Tax=Irpex rosettiformis TaxID=378272 RepID=A0ACB8TS90_9APHY|nr:hypothetical protein BDY19DRAFT_473032 [Irpex rosettiformis]